jgi:lysophospholipase L1-like esterase
LETFALYDKAHCLIDARPCQESPTMRRILASIAFFLLLTAASNRPASAADDFFFRSGDRILFLGDSITEQYQYSSTIELYLTTRFPNWHLSFLNAGIGGDTAQGGAKRFAAHVLAEKPTAITINFGMNDGGYGAFDPKRHAVYVAQTEAMLVAAKDAGVRVALASPNAVDRRIQERFKLYLETQKEFYAPLRELAAKSSAAFVDQYAITRAALERMEQNKAIDVRPFHDGFHTASPGGLFMAHAILSGLHAPALVSQVDIDISGGPAKTQACTVTGLERSPTGISFERTDESLPIPIQKDWVSLLPYVNDLKDLNWYGLKVNGLAAGKYSLLVDGTEVAAYTAEQLAAGVNLGNLTSGPIHAQGQQVFDAINAKNLIVHQRFRGVVMFQAPDWLTDVAAERKPRELTKRLELITAKQVEIDRLVQPAKHRFELKPVKS